MGVVHRCFADSKAGLDVIAVVPIFDVWYRMVVVAILVVSGGKPSLASAYPSHSATLWSDTYKQEGPFDETRVCFLPEQTSDLTVTTGCFLRDYRV